MRLIDAEAEIERIRKRICGRCMGFHADSGCGVCSIKKIISGIENAPTIEAKPVVYCKDCKYNVANSKHEPLDITDYTDITCEYFMTDGMSPNDFCSQGVKIPVISMEDVPKLAKEMEK